MKKTSVKFMATAGMTAAVYTVLTLLSAAFGLSSGIIQIRISEALCVLPYFTSAAIPGLFLGCVVSNLLTGCMPLDVIFGSLATFVAAVISYFLAKTVKKHKICAMRALVCLPNVIANTVAVPFILRYVYALKESIMYFVLTVGIGEIISSLILGLILFTALEKKKRLFK